MCESHICNGVSVKSVAKILALADRYKATELKSVCLKFTAENLAGMHASNIAIRVGQSCVMLIVFWFSWSCGNEKQIESFVIRFSSVWLHAMLVWIWFSF